MKRKYKFALFLVIPILFTSVFLFVLFSRGCTDANITERDFEKYVTENKSAIIYFWQDSCGACQSLRPLIEKVSEKLNKDIYFLNSDKVKDDFWKHWNICVVPSIIRIDNGIVSVFDNFSTEDDIAGILNNSEINRLIDRQTSIVEMTYDEFLGKINSNTDFILYIGRSDCRDCNTFYPILEKYVLENKRGLYYFNIKQVRDQSISESLSNSNAYSDVVEKLDLQWVPSVFHISSGEVMSKFEYLSKEYYALETEEDMEKMREECFAQFVDWMESIK